MRLTAQEQRAIAEEIRRYLPNATIYLYGSRVDDRLKGGDIDLLVMAPNVKWEHKIDILLAIKGRIGEQRIDLKMVTPKEAAQDAFIQAILPGAVRLQG